MRNFGDYFTKHHSTEHQKLIRTVYLYGTNSGQDYERVCYSKCNYNITQGKHMLTGDNNNKEAQSGLRTNYIPITGRVKTKPSMRHFQTSYNKAK